LPPQSKDPGNACTTHASEPSSTAFLKGIAARCDFSASRISPEHKLYPNLRRSGLSKSSTLIFIVLGVLGYLVSPVALVLGWNEWVRTRTPKTIPSIFSLVSFILASFSALLAIWTIAYANVHTFRFHDPQLMRIFASGILLSAAGFCVSLGGVWRKNPLLWHSLLSSLGTLAFWILAAAGE
jgi:hypothetical protein